jgi:hypothetical protein
MKTARRPARVKPRARTQRPAGPTIATRRSIFRTLVIAQDSGNFTVPGSRRWVMQKFKLTEAQLRAIEREGIAKEWSPLDEEIVADE